MRLIKGKKGRNVYYYDRENMTISDKAGNTIKIYETLDGIPDSDLQDFIDGMFSKIYLAVNEFRDVCAWDKSNDTVWERFK